MTFDKTQGYLSDEQSSAIKGLVMLLIILGHNHILAPIGGSLFNYLYSFHIYCFFILPFLYNKKIELNKKNVINTVIRNWIPYLFFFIICYFIYHFIVLKDGFDFAKLIFGILNASGSVTKKIAGFIFLWFMPTFCAMTILRMIYVNANIYIKLFILFLVLVLNYNFVFTCNYIFTNVPLAITQGLYYFSFGFLTKLLLDRIPFVKLIGAGIFVLLSILYWYDKIILIRYLFPISGFLFIYSFNNILIKIPGLVTFGKYSFPVYLVHVIIYNILEIKMPRTLPFGIVSFIITIALSLFVAFLMLRIKWLNKLILPRNWYDIKSLFIK